MNSFDVKKLLVLDKEATRERLNCIGEIILDDIQMESDYLDDNDLIESPEVLKNFDKIWKKLSKKNKRWFAGRVTMYLALLEVFDIRIDKHIFQHLTWVEMEMRSSKLVNFDLVNFN